MSKLKDSSEEYSSTKYTTLTTTSSSSSTKIKPPLWNTFEFYIYYVAVAFSVFHAFKAVYDLSQETHPNYSNYSKYLTKGWMFGRKLDNTDIQLAVFRNNYFLLAFALIIYLIISHLYRILFISKSSKTITQSLKRTLFFLGFSTIFLYVLFGNSIIFIFIILSLNYVISKVFEGSIFNPSITWIFNLSVLFSNEAYSGYKFSNINDHLEFLDDNRGLLHRWDVTFNICMLRLLSYNMDYYWSFHPTAITTSPERKYKDATSFTETERIITPCCKEDYNFIYYLSYILYTPLFLAGPIITYNDFISQLRYSRDIDVKGVLLYGIRLLGAILLMEVMLHYIYVVVIGKAKAWDNDTPFELGMIGLFNLLYVWLKLLIMWRFFRFWAMADGIMAQENMIRCMMNNYSTSGFWRSWHRSYYKWLLRYIYIPLGGNKHPVFNILVIFTFVALWHDISLKLLAWGWLIWLFILPEKIGTTIFSEKKWGDWPYYRHLCAVGAVGNLLMMWMANLIGFAIGLDGMKVLLINIFMTKDGLIALGLTGLGIFCGAQIMFEIREEEKRKGIQQETRY
ncbi:hypothetical protein Glove_712g39 [Diversispora epigaea]|uniref:Glycerol transporter n=1 Tax=Diversispora epigaea TaxID=1348612 RepID=A0A397G184_9GLOM|nr:hypothetical protein Glove_712g39 [Diversispora epigaea]